MLSLPRYSCLANDSLKRLDKDLNFDSYLRELHDKNNRALKRYLKKQSKEALADIIIEMIEKGVTPKEIK